MELWGVSRCLLGQKNEVLWLLALAMGIMAHRRGVNINRVQW